MCRKPIYSTNSGINEQGSLAKKFNYTSWKKVNTSSTNWKYPVNPKTICINR